MNSRSGYLSCAFLAAGLLLVGTASGVDAQGPPIRVDEKAVLKVYKKGAVKLALPADGKFLACVNPAYEKNVMVWDTATRKPLKSLDQDQVGGHLAFCPVSGNLAVSASAKGNYLVPRIPVVVIWNIHKGEKVRTLEYAYGPLAYSPDGKLLATGRTSKFFSVRLWDSRTGEMLAELEEHTKCVQGLAFSPDGKLLASSSWDGSVILWNVATRKKLAKWQPFTKEAYCVAFSPDGKTLVVGGNCAYREPQAPSGLRTPSIIWWDVAARKEIGPKHRFWSDVIQGDPKSLTFSRDGKLLLVGCTNFDLEIMDVAKLDHWAYLWGRWQAGKIESLALSPDGKTVLTGYQNGEIGFWEVPKAKQRIDWEAIGDRNDKIKEEKRRRRGK